MNELSENGLNISRPVSVWNKDISLEPRKFLQGIGKMVIEGVCQDWSDLGSAAVDTLDALGLARKPGDLAWLLIYRSLAAALFDLVKNSSDLFRNRPDEEQLKALSTRFEEQMGRAEVTITPKFFNWPGDLSLLKDLQGPLRDWLQGLGAQQTDAEQITCRLPDYFVFALHETWRKAPQDYAALSQHFDSPFTRATDEVLSWQLYKQWLQRQVSERMFEEAFGVEKVYVPLRAYYEEKEQDEERGPELAPQRDAGQRIVVDLESEFRNWLDNFAAGPAVRFISGGPGSGKSTFAKIFAARIARETDIPCLYIPLHLFDAADNLTDAMERHIRNNRFLSGNPLMPRRAKTGSCSSLTAWTNWLCRARRPRKSRITLLMKCCVAFRNIRARACTGRSLSPGGRLRCRRWRPSCASIGR